MKTSKNGVKAFSIFRLLHSLIKALVTFNSSVTFIGEIWLLFVNLSGIVGPGRTRVPYEALSWATCLKDDHGSTREFGWIRLG